MKRLLTALLLVAFACSAPKKEKVQEIVVETIEVNIKAELIDYEADGITMKGYISYDDSKKGKRPGILVVHEWWGHNDYVRERADMLAEMGYVALAVDMYGDGKTAEHPEDAGKFAGEVSQNMEGAMARFEEALEVLKNHEATDVDNIAAIGYCFGGGVVLEVARAGYDLDGVVSFHGSLATSKPAKDGDIKASILVCHGADDPFVKAEDLESFKKEMADANVDFNFESYPGAVHGFTSEEATELGEKFNLPLAYNEEADTKSWESMQAFFSKVFAD